VREILQAHTVSIRKVFNRLDGRYYGHISTEEFRRLLDDEEMGLTDLTSEQKDMVVRFVDIDCDGKIDYREFFEAIFRGHFKARVRSNSLMGTCKMVVVIMRHGARFPLKPFPLTSSWPRRPEFWDKFGGRLTPIGQEQLHKLGSRLRDKYKAEAPGLIVEDDPKFPSHVYVYTSNSERTLGSAQSLLLSLFPTVPQSFAIENDEKIPNVHHQGIEINIADMSTQYSPLLHGFQHNPKYTAMREEAFARSSEFERFASEKAVQDLALKLWEMTEFSKLNPQIDLLRRIKCFQSMAQQIAIERAHKLHLFCNFKGIRLEEQDEQWIRTVADYICRLRFQGLNDDQQRELARLAAGTLPVHIIRQMRGVIHEKTKQKFAIYSAHDNTIMALLSHMGFRNWKIPQFAAHIIFELHQLSGPEGSEYAVRFSYSDDPNKQGQYKYVRLPPRRDIVNFDEATEGDMSFEEFQSLLFDHRRSFVSEQQWQEEVHQQEEPEEFPEDV
jgi:broad specificity phosphatase PhoE